MIATLISVAFLAAFLAWLMGFGRKRSVAPEDDVDTPINRTELEEAERAIRDDPDAKAAADAVDDDDDDWGPGSGHSALPGVI